MRGYWQRGVRGQRERHFPRHVCRRAAAFDRKVLADDCCHVGLLPFAYPRRFSYEGPNLGMVRRDPYSRVQRPRLLRLLFAIILRIKTFLTGPQRNTLTRRLRLAHRDLKRRAEHDGLTGLLTRNALVRRLKPVLAGE